MRDVERQLTALARQLPDVTLLQTVPGVGVLTATALVALVGDIRRFRSGRHFASFLGLTPKEASSAGRRHLGAISKQGDVYVRMLLTHGARSFVWHAKTAAPPTSLQRWAASLEQRRGHNVATVAVANTLARIVWAVWGQQRPFAAQHRPGSSRIRLSLTWRAAPSAPHHGAPVGPARGNADNLAGREGPCMRLAPRARISMMAQSRDGSSTRPKIRLQSDSSRSHPGTANSHGAAGVPLRDEGPPSSPATSTGERNIFTRRFLLDGGVQIRLVRLLLRMFKRRKSSLAGALQLGNVLFDSSVHQLEVNTPGSRAPGRSGIQPTPSNPPTAARP